MKLKIPLLAEFYEYTQAARRLERMAAKGWRLREAETWLWTFEKTAPQVLHYSVVYFPDISDLDPEPKTELLDYIAMCEAAGWQLAARREQMLIFCTAEEDPVPIDTDPVIQVEMVRKVMKKVHVRAHIFLILYMLFRLWRIYDECTSFPMHFLSYNVELLDIFWVVSMLLISCGELVTYWLWLRRARAAAERGAFVPSKRGVMFTMLSVSVLPLWTLLVTLSEEDPMIAVFMLLWFVLIVLMLWGLKLLGVYLKNHNYDAGSIVILRAVAMFIMLFAAIMGFANFVSDWKEAHHRNPTEQSLYYPPNETWYYYDDPLLMSLEELGVVRGDAVYDSRSSVQESVLLKIETGSERPVLYQRDEAAKTMPRMSYTLTVMKCPWLREYVKEYELFQVEEHFQGSTASVWQADQVLKHPNEENYLVIWEDRVLTISFSWEPTPEQITAVTEIMKGGETK